MRKSALMCILIVFLTTAMFLTGVGTSFARSPAFCDNYARDYAGSYANGGGNVLGGAVGGAALGALFGAIAGAPGRGAGIGAGVGALGGGAASANDWNYLYSRAYDRCMRGYPLGVRAEMGGRQEIGLRPLTPSACPVLLMGAYCSCPVGLRRSLSRSISTKKTGTKGMASKVEAIMPPKTTVPRSRWLVAPAPKATTSGKTPRMNANEVIRWVGIACAWPRWRPRRWTCLPGAVLWRTRL